VVPPLEALREVVVAVTGLVATTTTAAVKYRLFDSVI